jgi:hypothetical protein
MERHSNSLLPQLLAFLSFIVSAAALYYLAQTYYHSPRSSLHYHNSSSTLHLSPAIKRELCAKRIDCDALGSKLTLYKIDIVNAGNEKIEGVKIQNPSLHYVTAIQHGNLQEQLAYDKTYIYVPSLYPTEVLSVQIVAPLSVVPISKRRLIVQSSRGKVHEITYVPVASDQFTPSSLLIKFSPISQFFIVAIFTICIVGSWYLLFLPFGKIVHKALFRRSRKIIHGEV